MFLQEHGGWLLAVLQRRFHGVDCDDLMQAVLLHLCKDNWHVLQRWDGRGQFRSYLASVAIRKAIDELRHRENFVDAHNGHTQEGTEEDDEQHNPYAYASSQQISDMVKQVLRTLSVSDQRCRKLLVLKYLHFFSYQEISEVMSLSINQVGVYLNRCLKKCRYILQAANPFDQ